MNEILDLRRVGLLIRGDAIVGYRSLLVKSAVLALVILVVTVYTKSIGNPLDFGRSTYAAWFSGLLFVWGAIISSGAFGELHDKTRNEAFLLLPSSALEKTLARLLIVTVGFVLYLLLFTTVVSLLTETVYALLFDRSDPVFQPFTRAVWVQIGHYVILQSIFFLGAAWFRKNHFFKTVLSVLAGAIGLAALGYLIVRIVFAPYFQDGELSLIGRQIDLGDRSLLDAMQVALQAAYFVVLPLFCWTVAWLRVSETEVSDGV